MVSIIFGSQVAGLVDVLFTIRGWVFDVHFLIRKDQRQWGYVADYYDGPLYSFGLGPFILICWMRGYE
jgi:hypothetical protein